MADDSPLSSAKQVLLNALDSINEVEDEMNADVRHVAVVWSVHHKNEDGEIVDNGGWNHSSDPAWLIGTLLRRGADSIEASTRGPDDGGGEE